MAGIISHDCRPSGRLGSEVIDRLLDFNPDVSGRWTANSRDTYVQHAPARAGQSPFPPNILGFLGISRASAQQPNLRPTGGSSSLTVIIPPPAAGPQLVVLIQ